ncbi:MAG: aldehyde ferredoxin oxidoreductase N-terminal domain-containing protein, partial [Candidatus Hermodarchaeota archaeon]
GNEKLGRILEVDLKNKTINEIDIHRNIIKKYLGGTGFAIDYLMKQKAFEFDPLSENNPFVLMTGLLTGTTFPCSGFYTVSARSPLTNIYGEGASGGFFGAELRKSLNGVVFKNKADSPVYLVIEDEHYELKDASKIWGLTTDKIIPDLHLKLSKQ